MNYKNKYQFSPNVPLGFSYYICESKKIMAYEAKVVFDQ